MINKLRRGKKKQFHVQRNDMKLENQLHRGVLSADLKKMGW